MKHDLLLLPLPTLRNTPALSVSWDEDDGTLDGRDAERARDIVADAERMGFVAIDPPPCSHQLSDAPLRSRADMAAIFGRSYILPTLLADAMPVWQPGEDEDDGDIDVTY